MLYNAACAYCTMDRPARRWTRCARHGTPASATPDWARRDPDLPLHGDPEFERMYPEQNPQNPA